jgi:hypothetical protein
MHRWLLILVLGCDHRPLPGDSPGPAAEPANRDCSNLPLQCSTLGDTCSDGEQVCFCDSLQGPPGIWYCRPRACPDAAAGEGEACAVAGLSCEYGLEYACNCVAPELRWACSQGAACGKMSQGMPCYANPPSVLYGCPFGSCPAETGTCYCMQDHWDCRSASCT